MIETNYISFRDKVARVVKKESFYYRYIFNQYKAEYDHLMQSGLYIELIQKGLLIQHQEIEIDTKDPKIYKLLLPIQIPFQSYPFEWSFIQWKKAISTYLKINNIAIKYGMILKDASPYNFYLQSGKAIMFDTSSFIFFKENDKWIAYRQFCEEFLGPFALMYYNGAKWSKLTIANLRGLPLNFISKQLSTKSWFNLTILLNIHLHAKYLGKKEIFEVQSYSIKGFSIKKIKSLFTIIFNTVSKWNKPYQFNQHWVGYYENDIESQEYLSDKKRIISEWLEIIKPNSVLDLAANIGDFSFIAANYAEKVIALDYDEACVDEIESEIKKNKIDNITTLVCNLVEPSPNIGLLNKEIDGIYKRLKCEMVFALAITHHLLISNSISFKQLSELIDKFSSKYVIVEFIDIQDIKVKHLMKNLNVNESFYNESAFIDAFLKKFIVKQEKKLGNSKRKLFLLQKKDHENI